MTLRRDKREIRRTQAKERQESYNALSNEEKIAKLDRGNYRANKQRARL